MDLVIYDDGGGIHIKLDRVDDSIVFATHEAIHTHPDFESLTHVIIDMLDVSRMDLSVAAVREVARRDAAMVSKNPELRLALVAHADVIRGMSNVYRSQAEATNIEKSWQARYCESLAEASEWLSASANTSDN